MVKQLIISIIFLIISISTTLCNNFGGFVKSDNPLYITFTPYDSDCKNPIPGIGFGTFAGNCVYNYSVETTGNRNCASFLGSSTESVNFTSYAYAYDQTIVNYAKIFTVDTCGFNEFSNTNYYVSTSKKIEVPKDMWVIETLDIFCETVFNYWFVSPGTSIPDSTVNQTVTYTCDDKIGYTTTCNGVIPDHTDNCLKLENPPGCPILEESAYQIYCSSSWW